MILIITNSKDKTVDYLLDKIDKPFFRFDTDNFIRNISFNYNNNNFVFLNLETKENISSDKLRGIIYRRPVNPIIELDNKNDVLQNELSLEAREMYESIVSSINTKWMSYPYYIRYAENKIIQLKVAKSIGIKTPNSIITNSYEDLENFMNKKECDYCIKPLNMGIFEINENLYAPYNNIINKNDDLDLIKNFPALIQEYINKKYEIRVIIVGNSIFSIKIDSQKNDETKLDWRINNCMQVDYSLITLPDDIQKKCFKIVNNFNLNFSSIDLILDKNDNYYFLDLNPNGQWAWIDEILNLNISNVIGEFFYE